MAWAFITVLGFACDAGPAASDAGAGADTGTPARDAGVLEDAGALVDAGESIDAGGPVDAAPPNDAGTVLSDAGALDGGSTTTLSFFVTSRSLGCPTPCGGICGFEFDNNDIDENSGGDCSSGSGDLGGLSGADAHCQSLAAAVGAGGRVWRAYLSTSAVASTTPAVNARDRIGAGPWFNAAGVLVASDVDALHALTPGGSFGDSSNDVFQSTALTEQGAMLRGIVARPADGDHDILTGSRNDGTAYPPEANRTCDNWTRSSNRFAAQVGHPDRDGMTGGGNDGRSWNSAHTSACSAAGLDATAGAGYFYCFASD